MNTSFFRPAIHSCVLITWICLTTASLAAETTANAAQSQSGARGVFTGSAATTYPDWFKQSFLELDADVDEATEAGKRVLVVFHQDGCPYCNALVERNLSQRDIEAHMKRHFDVIEVNIWGDRTVANVGGQTYTEKTFAEALRVQYTPTLLFFDEKGRIVLRLNGYVPPEKFKVALEYVSGRHELTIRYRDYVKANLPAVSSESLLPESFFAAKPFDLRQVDMPKKPIAVFFEQSHCPACEALHRDILGNARSQALASGFYAVQLDMWSRSALTLPNGKGATAREWAAELNVSYAPTIILLDETGTEIIRVDSELKTFHTQSVLDYVSSGAYRTQKDFQRYISTRAQNLIEQGENVDIWK